MYLGEALRKQLWIVQQRFLGRPVTLLYHRIAADSLDPWGLCVTPENFREHLEVLRRNRRITCPATEIAADGNEKVAITFDDGYADNLWNALPALREFNMMATLFVVAGQPDSGREFWWDELERIVLLPASLPSYLEISVGEASFRAHNDPSDSASVNPLPEWRAWDTPPTPRHLLFKQLYDFLQPLPSSTRLLCLARLRDWSGVSEGARESRRCLSWQELRGMVSTGHFSLGGHTVTHSNLAALTDEEQRVEIGDCKSLLYTHLGLDTLSFSYPFGSYENYNNKTIRHLRAFGYRCAFTNVGVGLRRPIDPYQLPRLYVWNWSGDEFARKLGLRS